MDEFEVFFSFYGLLLGLAAAEILSSVGALAREGSLREIRWQPALLAFLTFLLICATWIDAWTIRTTFTLDFRSLWAPIGAATTYYLAAVVVLPRRAADWQDADAYFNLRKRFVVISLVLAELFVKVMFFPWLSERHSAEPAVFWLYHIPLNVAIFIAFAAMFLAKSRRANIAAIAAQIVIFTIPYWSSQFWSNAIREAYGYPRGIVPLV